MSTVGNCKPSEEQINWLEDGEPFVQAAHLDAVTFEDGKLCFSYDTARWPTIQVNNFKTSGVYWVIAYIGSRWVGSTYEWISPPGRECKAESEISIAAGAQKKEFNNWKPKRGELVGFMLSTPVRYSFTGTTPISERTNIVWIRWP